MCLLLQRVGQHAARLCLFQLLMPQSNFHIRNSKNKQPCAARICRIFSTSRSQASRFSFAISRSILRQQFNHLLHNQICNEIISTQHTQYTLCIIYMTLSVSFNENALLSFQYMKTTPDNPPSPTNYTTIAHSRIKVISTKTHKTKCCYTEKETVCEYTDMSQTKCIIYLLE